MKRVINILQRAGASFRELGEMLIPIARAIHFDLCLRRDVRSILNNSAASQSHSRGWPIYYDTENEVWRFKDNKEPIDHERPCHRCGRSPVNDMDACTGFIPGAHSVCCGHGVARPILMLEKERTE